MGGCVLACLISVCLVEVVVEKWAEKRKCSGYIDARARARVDNW